MKLVLASLEHEKRGFIQSSGDYQAKVRKAIAENDSAKISIFAGLLNRTEKGTVEADRLSTIYNNAKERGANPDEVVARYVLDRLLEGPDDKWSGYSNDRRREEYEDLRLLYRRVLLNT